MNFCSFLQSIATLVGGLVVIYLICKTVGRGFLKGKTKNERNH